MPHTPAASHETPEPGPAPAWHALEAEEALERLGSRRSGLTAAEAAARLARFGPNRLPEPPRPGPLRRLLRHLHDVLIYVLLASALVTAFLQHWVDTGVILGVVLINAIVGFVQEGRAERALDSIRLLLAPQAVALREGHQVEVPAESLVPGDVIVLQAGDRVPADARLLEARDLAVDESALTGESMPTEKHPAPVPVATPLADRRDMVHSGTLVTRGRALAVVTATGAAAEIGRIGALVATAERVETPLLRQMKAFGRTLTAAILALAAATFAFGVAVRGQPAADMFMAAVGLAVAAIPEGLPAILTIALAVGVQRMARRHAIIRRLPAVDTLGAVTVICSDKTGTLTRNELTTEAVVTAEARYTVTGVGYGFHGEFRVDGQPVEPTARPDLMALARAALLASEAEVALDADGKPRIAGDPVDAALVVLARKAGLDPAAVHGEWPRTDLIPFDPNQRLMASLHHDHAGHGCIFVKGAPERLLELCVSEHAHGGDRPIDHGYWHLALERLTGDGLRVLAVAMRPAPAEQRNLRYEDLGTDLVFLGLVGLADPPRPEAVEAVARCRAAGIRVKMITGDHAATARAIAVRLGLGEGEPAVLTGAELDPLDGAALARAAGRVDVFARTAPEHKLALVRALQRHGEVVAMTGDGVNDAPALRQADVGVAMGRKGTAAAREAAEVVLADDNFASIAAAVEEGRTVYDNIRKAIAFVLPTNAAEAGVIVAAVAAGQLLPITPVQILWVNMVTAVTLALAIAVEPAEADVMRRPPRPRDERLLSPFVLWRTAFVGLLMVAAIYGLFAWELAAGSTLEAARAAAVNALVLLEAAYLLNARRLRTALWARARARNPWVPAAVATVVLLQLPFTYLPAMQAVFGTAAPAPGAWLRAGLAAALLLLAVEAEKAWLRYRASRRNGRPSAAP